MSKWTPEMLLPLAAKVVNPEKAAKYAAGILNGTRDPDNNKAVKRWLGQCYHRPSHAELVMCALNDIFEMHGVEALHAPEHWVDNYHGDIIATYLNTGDTYAETIVHDSESGEFLVTSWGDWFEAWEQAHPSEQEAEV